MGQQRRSPTVIVLLACAVLPGLAEARQASAPSPAPAPLCRAAHDVQYGVSVDHPVQVGGGGLDGPPRERHYLDALRGPQGERVRYTRLGSRLGPDGDTMLDLYELTYDGLATPVTLVLDEYHFTEPLTPAGFVCGRAFALHTPPPDPQLATEQLSALAAELSRTPGFRAAPVTLGDDPASGLVIDRFRLASRRARATPRPAAPAVARAAKPRAASEPVASSSSTPTVPGTVVVAFPQMCGTRSVSATGVALIGQRGVVAEPAATFTDAAAVRERAPGQTVPVGSIAATFEINALLEGLQVRLTYSDPTCVGEAAERRPPITYAAARVLESPMPARPADDTSDVPWVAVQAVIDHQGLFQQVRSLGGPPALVALAATTIATWKVRPATANGAPLATAVVLQVTFQPPTPP